MCFVSRVVGLFDFCNFYSRACVANVRAMSNAVADGKKAINDVYLLIPTPSIEPRAVADDCKGD